jgi:hypothetical protein
MLRSTQYQEPILWISNLQLQCQRCSSIDRFSWKVEKYFQNTPTRGVVNIYNAGVVT